MQLLLGIIALPETTLVIIPGILLWLTASDSTGVAPPGPAQPVFWLSVLMAGVGLLLALWTARLLIAVGKGTPAPWDPPRKLVVFGPYRYVWNPMITGVLLVLAGEALFFGSWPIVCWLLVFYLIHALYLLRFEEPGLERRYGEDYREYKVNVPRWLPRRQPWHGA